VTFTASGPHAESVAVKDGQVLPGLNDSHIQAMRAGLDWERTLHWEDMRSLAEARPGAAGRGPGGRRASGSASSGGEVPVDFVGRHPPVQVFYRVAVDGVVFSSNGRPSRLVTVRR
jgi:hypothetical protein